MRDDLLEAVASVNWAITQVDILQVNFWKWMHSNPYEVVSERDLQSGKNFAVAVERTPFPLELATEVGAIINALRSSLDILASALARRNGKKPSRERHFPIFDSMQCMIDPLRGIDGVECKKWLSETERTKIKALKPYKGGDDTIWPLHELDILRKHERLLFASGDIRGFAMLGPRIIKPGGESVIKRLENKTVLCEMSPTDVQRITDGNSLFTVDITFNEAAIGIVDKSARPALRGFAARVLQIIKEFDEP